MNTAKTKERDNVSAPKLKIGVSRQVAIPKKMYEELNLSPGDYLEAEVQNNRIVLTPKIFIEKRLAEGLLDIKKGRVSGSFKDAESMISSLRK